MNKQPKRSRSLPQPPDYSPTPVMISIPPDQELIVTQGRNQWKISRGKVVATRPPPWKHDASSGTSPVRRR